MKLYIKNMVCGRCEMAVKTELDKMNISISFLKLGEVQLSRKLTNVELQEFSNNLETLGFELLEDKISKTIEQIKNLIVELVHYQKGQLKVNLSTYLSEKLMQDYSSLSKLFSDKEQITVEHYFIAQKIEKAKELLVYDEMTLSQIAIALNYSNVAHLSNQFKKVTGLNPTDFKKSKENTRKQIDCL